MASVLDVQRALLARGYDIGPSGADGDFGRLTRAAVAKFQADHGLNIINPGSVGPKTLKALGLADDKPILPWMAEATKLLGLHEVTNAKTLDKLLRMDTSEIAWCGGFAGYAIGKALPNEPLPANPLGARNWMKFGRETAIAYGAVAVFWRGKKSGWSGHIGFVAGHDKTAVHVLGGNQSNKVSIARVGKDRLLGYRWPLTFMKPLDALPMTTITGTLSTNEA
jgi:uncharacterized protein (TIGR02594 family)